MTLRGSHTHIGLSLVWVRPTNSRNGRRDKLQGQSNLNQSDDELNMETLNPPESRRNSSQQGRGLSGILFLLFLFFPLCPLPCYHSLSVSIKTPTRGQDPRGPQVVKRGRKTHKPVDVTFWQGGGSEAAGRASTHCVGSPRSIEFRACRCLTSTITFR